MKLSPDKKLAGILEPVFAIRTEDDLGIGDTNGVRQMIDWCHKHGLTILQVLPINETSDDNSPYNAISSLAIEPTTITITPSQLPDLSTAKYRQIAKPELLAELRQGPVNYPQVRALKRALLWEAFQTFLKKHFDKDTERAGNFRAFLAGNADWISGYALFRVLMEEHGNVPTWDTWPAEHQNPQRAWTWLAAQPAGRREELFQKLQFFAYVQWIAYAQWAQIKEYGAHKRVYLMGDIPFGVGRYSADVWANRALFDLDWSGGAPPEKVFKVDPFTEKWGQNWGIPLYKWDVHRERNYDWWRVRVGNIHKVFHLFRIDHVLGFFRIYSFPWKPDQNAKFLPMTTEEAAHHTGGRLPGFKQYPDDTPLHCDANRQQGEDLLKMVLEGAGDTTVVAEDLGVVPPYVVPTLEKLGIPGFKIPHFLRAHDNSFVPGKTYPRLSLATPATHDHPPIAAMWKDLAGNEYERREWMKFAGVNHEELPREFDERAHEIILRGVLESNSWLAVFMITDVFGQEGRFNVPGSIGAGNWSYRLEKTVAELDKDAHLLHKTKMLARLVKESHRHP
jgi:4-alpha-glucanotransferase